MSETDVREQAVYLAGQLWHVRRHVQRVLFEEYATLEECESVAEMARLPLVMAWGDTLPSGEELGSEIRCVTNAIGDAESCTDGEYYFLPYNLCPAGTVHQSTAWFDVLVWIESVIGKYVDYVMDTYY